MKSVIVILGLLALIASSNAAMQLLPRAAAFIDVFLPHRDPAQAPFHRTIAVVADENMDALAGADNLCNGIKSAPALAAYKLDDFLPTCRDAASLALLQERGTALQMPLSMYAKRVEYDLRLSQESTVTDLRLLRDTLYSRPERIEFIHRVVSAASESSGSGPVSVCMLGFGMGHAALAFLSSAPNVNVFVFEGSESPSLVAAHDILDERFPNRLFLYLGDVSISIPRLITSSPSMKCDVIYLDGAVPEVAVRTALYDLIELAKPQQSGGHVLLLDVPADEASARNAQAAWVAGEDRGEIAAHAVIGRDKQYSVAGLLANGGVLLDDLVVGTYTAAAVQRASVAPGGPQ